MADGSRWNLTVRDGKLLLLDRSFLLLAALDAEVGFVEHLLFVELQ